jgi:putative SOS response-associated peptidase YedK
MGVSEHVFPNSLSLIASAGSNSYISNMCGRFALPWPSKNIQEHFMLPELPDLTPRYNIAPSQYIAAIRLIEEGQPRRLDMLRWGLIPHWAKDKKIGYKMINARAETLAEKPSFRAAFKKKRCLIAAGGFYEWQHKGGAKDPYYIQLKNESIFSFAGLWESWRGPAGEAIESCTIITTSANALVKQIHDRMPVIIKPENYDAWVGLQTNQETLQQFLKPYPAEEMVANPVSSKVNSPKNDTPDCLQVDREMNLPGF